jgi:hypothetical protein
MALCQTDRPRATTTRHDAARRPLDLHGKADGLLRDLAFVLQLTGRVKQAILADQTAGAPAVALAP